MATTQGATARAASNDEEATAQRGYKAMIGRTFVPPIWSARAYENAWKQWGHSEKPGNYADTFMDRYGLHAAPFANRGLPMGLRRARGLLGDAITNDCLLCHAGSIAGQSIIGLGNASLDLQALFDEMYAADGMPFRVPFRFSNARGTVEAGALLGYLMQFRDTDLRILKQPLKLGYRDDLCEDIPAWWHLKKKQTMYHNGGVSARSVRSIMTFMLSPLNTSEYIKRQEPVFADIQAWLESLQAPAYPFEIDAAMAERGEHLFRQNCVRCHGTYGPDGKYPNKHVSIDMVGTDPTLAGGFTDDFLTHYANSWFAAETAADGKSYMQVRPGYQAPPLDGIWATAPYFHNGSVPTVYHVLNSKARPPRFTRSFRTEREDYDEAKLGWRITEMDPTADPNLTPRELRAIYDTSQPGRANSGHTFGDHLSDEERMAVIEYLKSL
jgi:mono/diheme cytochrome c family protein